MLAHASNPLLSPESMAHEACSDSDKLAGMLCEHHCLPQQICMTSSPQFRIHINAAAVNCRLPRQCQCEARSWSRRASDLYS